MSAPNSISARSTVSWPFLVATYSPFSSHGQPFARAQCSTSRCPPSAAAEHVSSSHGQPFSRAHCSRSRFPPNAAEQHVFSSHGQTFSRAHCSTSRCPLLAALQHVYVSHGQPPARSHFSTSSFPLLAAASHRYSRRDRRPASCRRSTALKHPSSAARSSSISSNASPVDATAARIARLTAGSRARSAGSSKCSDLRMCSTTTWLGRPGKASPAIAGLASRRPRFLLRARVSAPSVATEDIAGGSCASLCVEVSWLRNLYDFWNFLTIRPQDTSRFLPSSVRRPR